MKILTILIIGDSHSDDIIDPDHGPTPVIPLWCAQMDLELLLGFEHRVIIDVHCAVLHLQMERSNRIDL